MAERPKPVPMIVKTAVLGTDDDCMGSASGADWEFLDPPEPIISTLTRPGIEHPSSLIKPIDPEQGI